MARDGKDTPAQPGDTHDTVKLPLNGRLAQITNFSTEVVLLSNPFWFTVEMCKNFK